MTVEIDLAGRVALVTGAGAGIGRGVASWFARAGARVAVNDIDPGRAASAAAELVSPAGPALPVPADCRDEAAVEAMVATVCAELGGLDVLVANVGMLPPGTGLAPVTGYGADQWRAVVDQNLVSAALCARAAATVMTTAGTGGVLLFVTSGETTRPAPLNAAYGAAKAAVNHLVTSLAVELGPAGIRACAMAPGTTATETVAAAFTPERMEAIVASTPLRRMVAVDELGPLAVFLASDLARCITGQFVLADAGAFLSRTRPANDEGLRRPPAGSASGA